MTVRYVVAAFSIFLVLPVSVQLACPVLRENQIQGTTLVGGKIRSLSIMMMKEVVTVAASVAACFLLTEYR